MQSCNEWGKGQDESKTKSYDRLPFMYTLNSFYLRTRRHIFHTNKERKTPSKTRGRLDLSGSL